MKLPTAEQMRNLDSVAVNRFGIPSIVLMENAGQGAAAAMVNRFGGLAGKVVTIFAGPGNNGGDGLVIARSLYQLGARPHVYLLAAPEKLSGDAAINLNIVRKLSIPLDVLLSADDLSRAEAGMPKSRLVVDAIFGTGLAREVDGHFAEAVKRINQFACPVVAVDVPSGLDSDTGKILGVCVQADMTATFGLAKPGLVVQPGARCAGCLEVIDIGIPAQAVAQADIRLALLDGKDVGQWVPQRRPADHKGTFGHLLVVAGSTGKTGAALLSARGALRSGVGLVSLCVPQPLNFIFESALFEAMTVPLVRSENAPGIDDYESIQASLAGKQAVTMGPGLGTGAATRALARKLYLEAEIPMVVDADALNALALDTTILGEASGPRVLTPHPGEMARLVGGTSKTVQDDRIRAAVGLATEHKVFVVLKGAGTVVASPDGQAVVNPTGNPGMAVGGTGDVLAGLIGGLLAQGLSPWQAACLGVYAHGLAGDRAAAVRGAPFGFTSSELAAELPGAFRDLT